MPVDEEQPHRVDGALGALVPDGVVVQVQGAVALQPLADDGQGLLAGVHADGRPGSGAAGVADGHRDLVQGPPHGVPLGEPGQLQQGLERDDQRHGLVGGQPQRPHHARGEGDPHAVALEGQVDEVTGPVAGQAAHPEQLEVAAQLPLADAEVRAASVTRTPSGRAVR